MENLKEKLQGVPYAVYDGLSIISSVISIITAIVAVVKAVVDVKNVDGVYEINLNRLFVWIIILIMSFAIVVTVKLSKYAKIVRKLKKDISFNYYNVAHDLRNSYFDILQRHKKAVKDSTTSRIQGLTQDTRIFLENSLNYLCEILSSMSGQEIHGCVKLIENAQGKSSGLNIKTATVRTFCRSKNSQPERIANDKTDRTPKRIFDNSDFYDILDSTNVDANSYFYQSNLVDYKKKLKASGKKYKNTTEDWEKYYRSSIVVPIRAANERLFFTRRRAGYDVIGFLCVDSMSTEAFRNNEFDKRNYTYIVKSFAAEMYIILNMYSYYLEQMKGGLRDA